MKKFKDEQKSDILAYVKRSIDDANDFYRSHLQMAYSGRQDIIDSSVDFYNKKFPNLAKIPLTSSEVYDTINWIMPALMEIFNSTDDVVSVKPASGNDNAKAQAFQDLMNYQTERLNDGFMNRHHWILSALEYNIGFKKKTWLRETETEKKSGVFDNQEIEALQQQQRTKITKETLLSEGDYNLDMSPLYQVDYEITNVMKNQPFDEIVPVTEIRWNSSCKNLKEAHFVAHKKVVTIDHLLQKQKAGIYFDIETVRDTVGDPQKDLLESRMRDYLDPEHYTSEDLRREVEIYECYAKYDMSGKDVLTDWVFTVAGEGAVLIGAQENTLGRFHPFLELVAMPDAWNVVPRKGLVELLAEIQHISTALTRLIIQHLALSNDGRRFINKDVVDQDDIINQAMDVAVTGNPHDAVVAMPVTNMSPMTMPFFELLQTKLCRTVGVSDYNTGGDAKQLNPTATGVTALIDQANKKINLMAQIMAHYFAEEYRYLIQLNQQFIDEPQVVRLLDKPITINPEDMEGKFDLIVNSGVGTANKNTEIQNTQLIIGLIEKIGTAIPGMVTADKVYNLAKLLLGQMGRKNVDDYINPPEVMQKIQQQQAQNKKPDAPKLSESMSIAFKDMPVAAQIQVLQQNGLQVSAQDYVKEAVIRKQIEAGGMNGNPARANQQTAGGNSNIRGGQAGGAVPNPQNKQSQEQMPQSPGGGQL